MDIGKLVCESEGLVSAEIGAGRSGESNLCWKGNNLLRTMLQMTRWFGVTFFRIPVLKEAVRLP